MNEEQFIEMMLRHHQSGLEVSELAAERAKADYLKDFCQKILRSHQQEINFLVNHLNRFHNLEVEPSPDERYTDEIESLKNKTGSDFDKSFLKMMIEHHRDMVTMIREQEKEGFHQEIKELLNDVANQQSREIGDMEYYLKNYK